MNIKNILLLALTFLPISAFSDGFSLNFAVQSSPHLIVLLTPEQIEEVGRTRRLVLNESQKELLGRTIKNIPPVLGVESLGEADCSCCISPAMWTETDKITIWINKFSGTTDQSEYYHTVRKKDRHFVMDAKGRIFHAGKEVDFEDFRRIAISGEYGVHLAMSPSCPPDLAKKLAPLRESRRVSSGL